MSLIQAALNKAASSQKQKMETPSPETAGKIKTSSKPLPDWPKVMDERLERELREVQRHYGSRRALGWKILAGVFILLSLVVLGTILQQVSNTGSPELTGGGVPKKLNSAVPEGLRDPDGNTRASFSSLAKIVPVISKPSLSHQNHHALKLTGILDLGEGARAVIDDRILAVGDLVGNEWVVMRIDPDEVTLESRGEVLRLKL